MNMLTSFTDAMPAFTDEYFEMPVAVESEVIDFRPWFDPIRSDMPDGLRWHQTNN